MKRDEMVESCKRAPDLWDLIIVGGGATGLGAAVDAASRGYRTLLLEQSDFAKGTSSRSTKLIHGGLRYLEQGNLALVIEALRERGLLCQNAPHLVSHLPFLVPYYRWWERAFYAFGIAIYDLLAGKLGIEKSVRLSREEALLRIPTLNPRDLRGGVIYYDGQFDDARLAISLAQTAADEGAVLINYCPVVSLLKEKGEIAGVVARDLESGEMHHLRAKAVINATGVFSDALRQMDDPRSPPAITPSQGIHLVLDRSFMPSDTALLIPKTDDGRILFCIPWHKHLLIGTTDTHVPQISLEPKPLPEEIDFLLHHAARYLTRPPKRKDILSVFTGLRPLVRASGKATAKISRNHEILVSKSGLITIAGGKWTTYRKMAEDVIDKAIALKKLPPVPCRTRQLRLHDAGAEHLEEFPPLHPRLPYRSAEVIWAVRHEMARTVEDVLARRTRALFLDAQASVEMAPRVAQIMAKELQRGPDWEKTQVSAFVELAKGYIIHPHR